MHGFINFVQSCPLCGGSLHGYFHVYCSDEPDFGDWMIGCNSEKCRNYPKDGDHNDILLTKNFDFFITASGLATLTRDGEKTLIDER